MPRAALRGAEQQWPKKGLVKGNLVESHGTLNPALTLTKGNAKVRKNMTPLNDDKATQSSIILCK